MIVVRRDGLQVQLLFWNRESDRVVLDDERCEVSVQGQGRETLVLDRFKSPEKAYDLWKSISAAMNKEFTTGERSSFDIDSWNKAYIKGTRNAAVV